MIQINNYPILALIASIIIIAAIIFYNSAIRENFIAGFYSKTNLVKKIAYIGEQYDIDYFNIGTDYAKSRVICHLNDMGINENAYENVPEINAVFRQYFANINTRHENNINLDLWIADKYLAGLDRYSGPNKKIDTLSQGFTDALLNNYSQNLVEFGEKKALLNLWTALIDFDFSFNIADNIRARIKNNVEKYIDGKMKETMINGWYNIANALSKTNNKGLYYISGGKKYVNGMNFAEAQQKCNENGGVLATIKQLIAAGNKGFNNYKYNDYGKFNGCQAAWLNDGTARWLMPKNYDGSIVCGEAGLNYMSDDKNKKYGAFCYGNNPNKNYPFFNLYNKN